MAKSGLGGSLGPMMSSISGMFPGMGGMGGMGGMLGGMGDGLSPTSGLALMGNPLSGLGMVGALLGKGDGASAPSTAPVATDPMDNLRRWSLGILADPILGKQESLPTELARGAPTIPPVNGMQVAVPQSMADISAASPTGDYHDYPWKTTPDATGHSLLDHGGPNPAYAIDNIDQATALSHYGLNDTPDPLSAPDRAIEVVGKDPYQPRKQTVLGAIADAFLMSRGLEPAFKNARDERNIREATAGFVDNPRRAISRLSKVPGQTENAWKMFDQLSDNNRMQSVQDRQLKAFDSKYEEGVLGVVSNMMNAATPDTWGAMRDRAMSYAKNKGVTLPFDIPEYYDAVADKSISYSKTDPSKQARIEQGDARVQQGDRRLDQGDRRMNITEEHYDASESQQATNEAGRNARAAQAEAGRNSRTKKITKTQGRVVPTPNGDMELSPSGNTGRIGNQLWRKVRPGQWERIR